VSHRTYRKYSDELRRRAVDEVLDRDPKVPEVTKQLGIATPETLRRWVVQAIAAPSGQIVYRARSPIRVPAD